ncbi:hypothetical protein WJX84_005514 [Apatococcus fuscideae]|uniref:Cytochrome P450 n=1 Tax=Apatococcus fuscideae TaxID=2026836 RepID=A0AAW1SQU2_9CHLO
MAGKPARSGRRGFQSLPLGFPSGPSGDQALNLLADPLGYLDRITQQHGPIVGLVLGGEYVVVVADAAAARTVLHDQSGVFVKEGTAFLPGSSLAGNGLLVSDGPVWRRQRQLSNPAFRSAAVQAYAKAMAASAQRLVGQTWRGVVPTPVNVNSNRRITSLNRLVYGMISQRRMQLRQQPHPPLCLLEELIVATDERGKAMGDRRCETS